MCTSYRRTAPCRNRINRWSRRGRRTELSCTPTGIAIAKAGKGSDLRGFLVRKEAKGRGAEKQSPPGIGVNLREGDRLYCWKMSPQPEVRSQPLID